MPSPVDIIYTPEIFSLQAFGGISRYFVELARHLRAGGQRPHVAAGLHINRLLRELPASTVTGMYLLRASGRMPNLRARLNRTLCARMAGRRPRTVVHQTYFGDTAYLGPRPLVLTIYDLIHEIYRSRFPGLDAAVDPASRHQRANCARADHLIAISESTKADLVRLFGVDPAKVTVIHLGNSLPPREDSAGAREPRGDFSPPVDGEFLLHVGARSGYKNFNTLLEAFSRSAPLRRRFTLLCFGGGPFSGTERQRIAALGVADKVVQQPGDDRALARCYRAATAFVYPSLYEGFGLPLLEAMGQRCPVFCGTGGSLPEVAGDAAAFFDPENAEAMQAMLEETLCDPSRLAGLAARGRERVQQFSWEKCARETLEVYRRMVG